MIISQKRNARVRRASGSAIVENSAMLLLMFGLAIALILTLLYMGVTMTYHQKISCIAAYTATMVSSRDNGWEYQNPGGTRSFNADTFAKETARQLGLPSNKISAKLSRNGNTTIVTVTGTNLPAIRGCPMLPAKVTVDETYAAWTAMLPRPTGLLSITAKGLPASNNGGSNPTVLIPCYSGLAQNDRVATRAQGDSEDPEIAGPGMYDQFSFSMPYTSGAAMNYTPGTRGMKP